MPNPNPECNPTIDFKNFAAVNTPIFRILNPGCSTSTGDFVYSLSFTDGSIETNSRSVSWTAADSSEDFLFEFFVGAKDGRIADSVYNISEIRCTCLD